MDQERFENLTRQVGSAQSRRSALRLLAVGAVAAVAPVLGARMVSAEEVTAEGSVIRGCRLPGQRCSKGKNCCTGKCGNGRCRCKNKGASCLVTVNSPMGSLPIPVHAVCCSNKCSKSTNKCR
ncbi:MAG: hypothetical protein IT337_01420 [Thermomicrobiales bacterium]|nr:hypothetical protein [Thermomicrobiales bacterium]